MNRSFDPELICPLCGVERAQHNGRRYVSSEHVPPRSIFFEKNDLRGLITVPSCASCNQGTSLLDEEFKTQLSVILGNATAKTKRFWDSAERTRKGSRHLHRKIDGGIVESLVQTPTGLLHPVVLDTGPVYAVIRKLTRGLHWYVTGNIVPPGLDPEVTIFQDWEAASVNLEKIFQEFGQSIERCRGQFEAHYAIVEDDDASSLWLFRFFGKDCFLAVLRPNVPGSIRFSWPTHS